MKEGPDSIRHEDTPEESSRFHGQEKPSVFRWGILCDDHNWHGEVGSCVDAVKDLTDDDLIDRCT